MSLVKLAWKCLLTPRLYRIHRGTPNAGLYKVSMLENYGDLLVAGVFSLWNYSFVTTPLVCIFIYKYDYLLPENWDSLLKLVGTLGLTVFSTLLLRALGRATNPQYEQFLSVLEGPEEQKLESLRKYDFDFSAFPVTFVNRACLPDNDQSTRLQDVRSPVQLLAFIAVRTFGIRMIFPGSLGIINYIIWSELLRGRAELVEQNRGKRHKIITYDGNEIDSMFVDNRERHANGSTLVICCEGNSGFYEVGIMSTPLAGGYSALGWNHPGFGGSTGVPYPSQEKAAIDAVMQLALKELGFQENNIVLYGWSIGGYPAAWAAAHYPNVRCVVLDATFDDLLPLAVARMPASWAPLVRAVVRGHVDLHVAELLLRYPGDVRLVRRTRDEIICLRDGELGSNCGNELLLRLLRHRHPELVGEGQLPALRRYLAAGGRERADTAESVGRAGDPHAAAALRLIQHMYLKDYDSTHCTPLPLDHFKVPSPQEGK